MISRRVLLLGGAGAVVTAGTAGFGLVEAEVLPGRGPMHRALGWDGPHTPLPSTRGGRSVDGSFTSPARRGRTVRWRVTYPPGMVPTARLPVAVALHPEDEDHRFPFDVLGVDRYLAEVTTLGIQPFAVVAVDGGADTYWHRRKNGDDPQRMIRDELLPRLGKRGLRTERIAVIGWSMGGYGALLFAQHYPAQVAGVAAVSPTLWRDAADAAPGAFDGLADFRRNDVFARMSALRGQQVRVDSGDVDPFVDQARELRGGLKRPSGSISEGGHNEYYWRRAMPGALGFLGDALAPAS